MLREEQIDIRRHRGETGGFQIENLGRNKSFSDFRVTNPVKKSAYRVSIRGFFHGDNFCECPDYKTNTLGTCKHIEAVLNLLRTRSGGLPKRRKALITQPEVFIRYEGKPRLAMQLPDRPSNQSKALFQTFFDMEGNLKQGLDMAELLSLISECPEEIVVFSDAMELIQQEMEQKAMAIREQQLRVEYANDRWHPDLVKINLLSYQVEGILFLAHRPRSILADDMGLGKTVQAIAAVELMARERGIARVLVVTPASLKGQWQGEVQRLSDRRCQVIAGDLQQRQRAYSNPTFFRIVNYETVKSDLDFLNAWEPDLIILDEAQRIRNWESRTAMDVKKLKSRFAFVLTGTPLENNLQDLHSILEFVDARRLGPAFQFQHDHQIVDEKGKITGYRDLHLIKEKLAPILLRRTRGQVLAELPGQNEQIIYLDMSPDQSAMHQEGMGKLAQILSKKSAGQVDKIRLLKALSKLRKECNFPLKGEAPAKVQEVLCRIQSIVTSEEGKVVVFSEWRTVLDSLTKLLREANIDHVLLHGQLSGEQRAEVVRVFREEKPCKVFLSTDAGSTGLNLQVADTLFNLDTPWNPATLLQRIARIHRLGQKKSVQIFHLIMKGSIEEKILLSQEKKQGLFQQLFAADAKTNLWEKPKEQELEQMIQGWLTPQSVDGSPAPEDSNLWQPLLGFLKALEKHVHRAGSETLEIPKDFRMEIEALCQSILNRCKSP